MNLRDSGELGQDMHSVPAVSTIDALHYRGFESIAWLAQELHRFGVHHAMGRYRDANNADQRVTLNEGLSARSTLPAVELRHLKDCRSMPGPNCDASGLPGSETVRLPVQECRFRPRGL